MNNWKINRNKLTNVNHQKFNSREMSFYHTFSFAWIVFQFFLWPIMMEKGKIPILICNILWKAVVLFLWLALSDMIRAFRSMHNLDWFVNNAHLWYIEGINKLLDWSYFLPSSLLCDKGKHPMVCNTFMEKCVIFFDMLH